MNAPTLLPISVAMGSVCYLFVTQDDVHPYILVPIILLPCVLPMIVSMIFKHCIRGGK